VFFLITKTFFFSKKNKKNGLTNKTRKWVVFLLEKTVFYQPWLSCDLFVILHWSHDLEHVTSLFHWSHDLEQVTSLFRWSPDLEQVTSLFHWSPDLEQVTSLFHITISLITRSGTSHITISYHYFIDHPIWNKSHHYQFDWVCAPHLQYRFHGI